MALLGELVIGLTVDDSQFKKSVDGAQSKLKGFSTKAKQIGGNLSKFVTLPITAIGIAAVKAASDIEESINAVNVTFKESSKTIQEFGKTASTSVGLSRNEFNGLATVIGAQLKTAGLSLDDTADQTIKLTQRAADLASVFNVDVKDATRALGSALRGEAEPARRFGINISEAAVKAEALSSGIIDVVRDLTDQERVQARLNIIYKQSNDVQGDFANTAGSLANQSRILKSDFIDLSSELGQVLLPLATEAVSTIRGLVGSFRELTDGQKKAVLAFGATLAALGPLSTALGVFAANPIVLAIAGVAALAAGLVILAKRLKKTSEEAEQFKNITENIAKTEAELAKEQEKNRITRELQTKSLNELLTQKTELEKLDNELIVLKGLSVADLLDILALEIEKRNEVVDVIEEETVAQEESLEVTNEVEQKKTQIIEQENEKRTKAILKAQKEQEDAYLASARSVEGITRNLTQTIINLTKEGSEQQKEAIFAAAIANKAAGVFTTIVNTAVAITEALKIPPPAGEALAIARGIAGAAQTAAILSEPLPALASGGLVTTPTKAFIGEGGGGEAIIPLNNTDVLNRIGDSIVRSADSITGRSAFGGDDRPIMIGLNIDGEALNATITDNIDNRRILINQESVVQR